MPLSAETSERAAKLEQLLGINPKARGPYVQLAQLYESAGRKDLAVAALRRFLQVDPQNAFMANRIAVLEGRAEARGPLESRSAVQAVQVKTAQKKARTLLLVVAAVAVLAAAAAVVKSLFFPGEREVAVFPYSTSGPRFSPDGSRIAWVAQKGDGPAIGVYDLATRKVREYPAKLNAWGESFVWSPSGLEIAFAAPDERGDEEDGGGWWWGEAVYVLDITNGNVRKIARGSQPTFTSSDSSLVLVCTPKPPARADDSPITDWPHPFLCRVDFVTRDAIELTDKRPGVVRGQPHGSLVVFEVDEEVDWEQWSEAAARQGGQSGEESAAAPDGTAMLENALKGSGNTAGGASHGLAREVKAENRRDEARQKAAPLDDANEVRDYGKTDIWVVDAGGSGLKAITSDGHSSKPRWTSDGKHVLFECRNEDFTRRRLCLVDPDGSNRRVLDLGNLPVPGPDAVALTPDTTRLIHHARVPGVKVEMAMTMLQTTPDDLYVLQLGSARAPRRLETKHSFKGGFDLSPDGKALVYEVTSKDKGLLHLWLTSL